MTHAPPDELALASSPHTPQATLSRLARSAHAQVQEAVARNPAAPHDALAHLAPLHPRAFFDNPALDLFELEVPAFYTSMSQPNASNLASNAATPPRVLARLATHPVSAVRASVAGSPRTPPATLAALAFDREAWVQGWAARNPSTPSHVLERIAERNAHLTDLLSNPSLPEHVRRVLARKLEANPVLLPSLPQGARVPLDAPLLADRCTDLGRAALLRAAHMPPWLAAVLAADPSSDVRAAATTALPTEALRILLHDPSQQVRLSARKRLDALEPDRAHLP